MVGFVHRLPKTPGTQKFPESSFSSHTQHVTSWYTCYTPSSCQQIRVVQLVQDKTVGTWAKECADCQCAKTYKHVHLQPAVIPVPACRFAHVHIDLVRPLPQSSGCNHIFTMMDRSTRWPEAAPVADTSARGIATVFIQHWVGRFGVPDALTSDRGPQFTSSVWAAVCSLLNIQHITTTAYHLRANGMLKRFHRRLKTALRASSTCYSKR